MSVLTNRMTLPVLVANMSIALCTLFVSPTYAQGAHGNSTTQESACSDMITCLNAIMQNTYATLQSVNNVPAYLDNITKMAMSWNTPDTSPTTATIQGNFATLGNTFVSDLNGSNYQASLTFDLLGRDPATMALITIAQLNPQALNTQFPTSFLNLDDIVYASLLGQPPLPKLYAATTPYNFTKYASGVNIAHTRPVPTWTGGNNLTKYLNYYASIMAITSYDSYILNNYVTESATLSTTQSSLINTASSPTWLASVATEELGKVLRQILMFQSQSYVLLTQMLTTERQLLATQAMTNTLLILGNQNSESLLLSRAQGQQYTGQ